MSRTAVPGPLARYRALVERGRLHDDSDQHDVAGRLQQIFERLDRRRAGWIARLRRNYPAVSGLYLHGGVGRGKTMLMDLFAESLRARHIPVWRIHFHRFMDSVHDGLRQQKRRRDPLIAIARTFAARARVLCFDEFHVSEIGDAMILSALLHELFDRGVTLVATSNTAPSGLYADGLQRERFIPAIEAIEHHCDIVGMAGTDDYRLRELSRQQVYRCPADERATAALDREFHALAAGEEISARPLQIRGRTIAPRKRAGSVVWFDFDSLCQGPRASTDYIELTRRFGTILISDVPRLGEDDNNAARRFVHLVDECYDRAVKLIVSADAAPDAIYTGQHLAGPFERTASRLVEMQSLDYLGRAHRP